MSRLMDCPTAVIPPPGISLTFTVVGDLGAVANQVL